MVAAEAASHGMVSVTTAVNLARDAQSLALSLAAKPSAAYALNKRWLVRGLKEEFAMAAEETKAAQSMLAASDTVSSN